MRAVGLYPFKMNVDYTQLSLAELKKLAKGRRIKLYYTKSISELRWLLSQTELPMNYKIEKFTIKQLRESAKEKGIRGFWNLNRSSLVELLYPSDTPLSDKKNQNGEDTQNHKSPQSNYSHEVGVDCLEYDT